MRAACVAAAIILVGCSGPDPSPTEPATVPASQRVPLRVVVAGDAELAEALPAAWQGVSEQPLEVRSAGPDELGEAAATADVMIFPAALMGDAVQQRWITPLPKAWLERTGGTDSVLAQIAEQQTQWGGEWYALSLGSPVPALLLGSEVEGTAEGELRSWQAFGAAAERLKEESDGRGRAAEPLADGWAATSFLTRAAAYVDDGWLFDRTALRPRLTEPAYVAALSDLVAAREHYPTERLTPEQIWSQLGEGSLQLAIGWPSGPAAADRGLRIAETPATRTPAEDERIAPLWVPGVGLVAAISRSVRQSSAARSLLRWATGPEGQAVLAKRSPRVLPTTMPLVDAQQPAASSGVPQYDQYLRDRLSQTVAVRPMLRLPGAERYLEALEREVLAAVAGDKPPADALAAAAEQWEAITDQLGRESQRAAWLISQGLPVH